VQVSFPEKIRDLGEKLEGLNNVVRTKDDVIEQLLQEITQAKQEKDELQNEVLFKK